MTATVRPAGVPASIGVPAAHAPAAPGDDAAEADLLARLRGGDQAAYEEMVRTYGGRLLAVARRLLRNEDDALDALQDGFLSACRTLKHFRGDARLSTWLHRIVVNAALMKLRTRRRRPEASIEDLLPAFREDGHHVSTFERWTDPEQALATSDARARMRAAIDELPESYRTVLVLRDIEELDTAQVAAALGITPNAVKIRLHRARQALVTRLAPIFRGDGGLGPGVSP